MAKPITQPRPIIHQNRHVTTRDYLRPRLTREEYEALCQLRGGLSLEDLAERYGTGTAIGSGEFAESAVGALPIAHAAPYVHDIPEGELRDNAPVVVTSERVGIISDVHAPYHDVRRDNNGRLYGAYITALEAIKAADVGTLLINGDFMDFYAISRHGKKESKRNLKWELDVSRAMLKHLRDYFGPDVRIIYKEGNHEMRWGAYINDKAGDLDGLEDFELQTVLRLSDLNIEWVGDKKQVWVGKLNVLHGHEYFGNGGMANPARNYRMKANDNVLVGHVHKTSEDSAKRARGEFIAGWSTGCLCDLTPSYATENQWNHGFAIVTQDATGAFNVQNRRIIDGRLV